MKIQDKNISEYLAIKNSKFFNSEWYIKKYSLDANTDPYIHYLTDGWRKGYDPSPLFSTNQYLHDNYDVKLANLNPLYHYEKWGKNEWTRAPLKKTIFSSELQNIKSKYTSIKNYKHKRIAIFADFNINGKIAEYVVYYLEELKKEVDGIVYISDNPLHPSELQKISHLIIYAQCEYHGEYDFGSYKRGYLYLKNNNMLSQCNELVFCNSSCYGPIQPFHKLFKTMSDKKIDFYGIGMGQERFTKQYYIQSYFIVLKKTIFTTEIFNDFLSAVKRENNYFAIGWYYEIGLTKILEENGWKYDSYIPYVPGIFINSNPLYYLRRGHFLLKRRAVFPKEKHITKLQCSVYDILKFIKKQNFILFNIINDDIKYFSKLFKYEKTQTHYIIKIGPFIFRLKKRKRK